MDTKKLIHKIKEKGWTKAILMTVGVCFLFVIMFTSFAESTDIVGFTAATFSGDVVVDGECYLGGSIGCVPSGSILFFTTSCPTGWTRQTHFDNDQFGLESTATTGGGGVSHSHTHNHGHGESVVTSSGGAAHTHSQSLSFLTNTDNHRHQPDATAETGSAGARGYWSTGDWSGFSTASHSHTTATEYTGSAGGAHSHSWAGTSSYTSPSLSSTVWTVPYFDVVVCEKD